MNRSRVLLVLIVALLPVIQPAGPRQTALADAALIALVLLAWPTFWRTRQILQFPLLGPQWLIGAGSLMATLVSADTLGCLVALVQDMYIYAWFVTVCNVITPGDWLWVVRAWVVAALIESGLIVLGAAVGVGVGALANEWGRGTGTFVNPNMAASYVVISFFVYLALPFPWARAWRLAGGALLLVAAFATGSNAGLVALAVGLAALGAYRLLAGRHTLWPWLGLAALAGAALCLLALLGVPDTALTGPGGAGGVLSLTVGRLDKGVASRTDIWGGAWRAFQQYPLGLGPGTSAAQLSGELHNDFLSHLVERGVLGLAGLLGLVAATLARLGQLARVERERRGPEEPADWVGPLLAGFAAALPFMLSHEILHFRHYWLFLALIFAPAIPNSPIWRQTVARAQSWTWLRRPT